VSVAVVYFSSASDNTRRFAERLDRPAQRIPLRTSDPAISVGGPYVLVLPTYGGGRPAGAVPKQVVRFLNEPANRAPLVGVIAAGNTNFGAAYCLAGDVISAKCRVPLLHRFELFGTQDDVRVVRNGLDAL
jgi:protein involved in ribonucleotide reduction